MSSGYDDHVNPQMGDDGKPYTTLNYANGPGFEVHRQDEAGEWMPRLNLSEIPMEEISKLLMKMRNTFAHTYNYAYLTDTFNSTKPVICFFKKVTILKVISVHCSRGQGFCV